MIDQQHPTRTEKPPAPVVQLRIWHLVLLVVFVAVAIVNIQDQRRSEPALLAIAAGGFVLYGLVGWAGWRGVERYRSRLGATVLLVLYLIAMAGFFLAATVIYLVIEQAYLSGRP